MAYRSIATNNVPTTSPTMTAPSGVATGDILVAAFTSDSTGTTMSGPAGWTALTGSPVTVTNDGMRCFVFTKQAGGSEPGSYAFTSSGSVIGYIVAISGRHATSYLHQSSALSASSGLSPATTAFASATTVECDLLWIAASDDGDVACAWTSPSGFTERADLVGSSSNFYGLTLGVQEAAASGETGAYTGSRTGFGGGNGSFAIALAVGDTSTIEQEKYQWFNDDGVEASATTAASENTGITQPASVAKIVRTLLDATGDPGSYAYQLEWKLSTDSTWRAVRTAQPTATASYGASGGLAYSAASGTSVTPTYPTGIGATTSALVLVVGQKPTTANGGTVTTPTGWTLVGSSLAQGGYGATLGADTGNTNLRVYTKDTVTGSESGTLSVTVGDNNVCWAEIHRVEASAEATWGAAIATGADASAGSVSITFGSNPGVTAGDIVLAAFCIPTDVTTPAQFSAHAFSQTGITFGTVTEIDEADNTAGNDIGGVQAYATVSSGTASAAPVWTATAGGTTTNVRGPGVFLRLRPTAVQHKVLLALSSNIPAGGTTATTARLNPPGIKTTSDFQAGAITDDTNPLPTLDLSTGKYTELAACVQPVAAQVSDGDVLQFRWTQAGIALGTYSQTPSWTIGTGGSVDDTITLTGDSVTLSAGTLASGISQAHTLTGDALTLSGGTVAQAWSAEGWTLSGAGVTLAGGTPTSGVDQSHTLTGDAITLGSGTLASGVDQTHTLTGAAVTLGSGTVASGIDQSHALTGDSVTLNSGTLTDGSSTSDSITLTGDAVTLGAGTLASGVDQAHSLTGASVALAGGTVADAVSQAHALTGDVVTVGAGTLASGVDQSHALTGAAITLASGTATVANSDTIALAGDSLTLDAGTIGTTGPDTFRGGLLAVLSHGPTVTATLSHGPTLAGTLTHGPTLSADLAHGVTLAAALSHGPTLSAKLALYPGVTMLDLTSENYVQASDLTNPRNQALLTAGQATALTVRIIRATDRTTVATKAGTIESATVAYAILAPSDLTSLVEGETYSIDHEFTMNSGNPVHLWDHNVTAGRYEPEASV